jgi:primosomal protein DnaI
MMEMKPIQSSIKKWLQSNENFKEIYAQQRREVLNDPQIKEFLSRNPELTKKEINKNLIKLYEFKSQSKQCADCASFRHCQNIIQGYSPILDVENHEIKISYEKCPSRIMHEQEQDQQKLMQSLYIPKEILEATVDQITETDGQRTDAIVELYRFVNEAKEDLPKKGIYFYGPFGVGKTYFLGALANKLRKLHLSTLIVYMPEFVREIKSSIKDDSIDKKIAHFKKVDVLMLDDIGAESQSAWFRDEVLGSILQYRMMEGLPVFFTSNYSLRQLEEQLSTTKSGVESVKAGRIMERIRQLSKEVKVSGDNRRQ